MRFSIVPHEPLATKSIFIVLCSWTPLYYLGEKMQIFVEAETSYFSGRQYAFNHKTGAELSDAKHNHICNTEGFTDRER